MHQAPIVGLFYASWFTLTTFTISSMGTSKALAMRNSVLVVGFVLPFSTRRRAESGTFRSMASSNCLIPFCFRKATIRLPSASIKACSAAVNAKFKILAKNSKTDNKYPII